MTMKHIACAFGKHRVDQQAIKAIHGTKVGRCRTCRTPMEEIEPHHWGKLRTGDAGLGLQTYR